MTTQERVFCMWRAPEQVVKYARNAIRQHVSVNAITEGVIKREGHVRDVSLSDGTTLNMVMMASTPLPALFDMHYDVVACTGIVCGVEGDNKWLGRWILQIDGRTESSVWRSITCGPYATQAEAEAALEVVYAFVQYSRQQGAGGAQ